MGGFGEFERYDAVGLAKLVRDKRVTPADLLDAATERVESRNADVNAVVSRLYEEARRAIAAGLPDGPFDVIAIHSNGVKASNALHPGPNPQSSGPLTRIRSLRPLTAALKRRRQSTIFERSRAMLSFVAQIVSLQ